MKKPVVLLFASLCFTLQAANSQFDIKSEDGNVSIGPGGINIQSGGDTVKIGPASINVKKPGKTVEISPTGINIDKNRNNLSNRKSAVSASTSVKTSGTASKAANAAGLSIEQRVGNLEMQVYGKRTSGQALIKRVEKLEQDNLGHTGQGTIITRVDVLSRAIGTGAGNASVSISTRTHTDNDGSTVSVQGSHGGVNISSAGQSGQSIITLNDSDFEGDVKCSNSDVVLNASDCKIHFVGTVKHLVVNGSSNELRCDLVQHVQVNGSENHVTWSSGANPSIANVGSSNTLKSR